MKKLQDKCWRPGQHEAKDTIPGGRGGRGAGSGGGGPAALSDGIVGGDDGERESRSGCSVERRLFARPLDDRVAAVAAGAGLGRPPGADVSAAGRRSPRTDYRGGTADERQQWPGGGGQEGRTAETGPSYGELERGQAGGWR